MFGTPPRRTHVRPGPIALMALAGTFALFLNALPASAKSNLTTHRPGPTVFRMQPPTQDPTSRQAVIRFDLLEPAFVTAAVYDGQGRRLVRSLARGVPMIPGRHALLWEGLDNEARRAAAGVYLLRIRASGHSHEESIVLTD